MVRSAAASAGTRLHRVLFIASHNYFRSRFCEELFNYLAMRQREKWLAFSRASRRSPAALCSGPMSPFAVEELRRRGIRPVNHLRLPLDLTNFDFLAADLVISLDEPHDRPIVENHWATYSTTVRYWDLEPASRSPAAILRSVERKVRTLLLSLASPQPSTTRARLSATLQRSTPWA